MRKTKKQIEQHDLHVKRGDRVILLSGKERYDKEAADKKIGNVKKVIKSENKVIVEGLNMVTKAQKANPMAGIQGGLNKIEAPVDSSKVMLYCMACESPTKARYEVVNGRKVRVCKKCGEQIDS